MPGPIIMGSRGCRQPDYRPVGPRSLLLFDFAICNACTWSPGDNAVVRATTGVV